MTVKVLQDTKEIALARAELKQCGWSFVENRLVRALRTQKWLKGINVGDYVKSWDILSTAIFAKQHVARDGGVLDLGAYASEILSVLNKMSYRALAGVDLNPGLKQMPNSDQIRYEISDFMATPFSDHSFQMVTAISVIEHGFDSTRLLKELSRLLKPGGYFVASFDYWPEKVDTTGQFIFDMSWTIFSKADIQQFLHEAAGYGLYPCGDCIFEADKPTMFFYGKSYTFGWMALQKQD